MVVRPVVVIWVVDEGNEATLVKNIVFRHVGCNLKGLATIDGSTMVMVGGVDGVGGMEEM